MNHPIIWLGMIAIALVLVALVWMGWQVWRDDRRRAAARKELRQALGEKSWRVEGSARADIMIWDLDGNRVYWCTARSEDMSGILRREVPLFSGLPFFQRRALLANELGDLPQGYSLRVAQVVIAD